MWNWTGDLLVQNQVCLFHRCDHSIKQSVVCIQRLTQDQLLNRPGNLDLDCKPFWTFRTIGSSGSSCCSVCEIHWQITFRGKSEATESEPSAVHRNQVRVSPRLVLNSADVNSDSTGCPSCRSTGGPGLKRACGETLEKQKEPNYKQETVLSAERGRDGCKHTTCVEEVWKPQRDAFLLLLVTTQEALCLFRRTSEVNEPPSCRQIQTARRLQQV